MVDTRPQRAYFGQPGYLTRVAKQYHRGLGLIPVYVLIEHFLMMAGHPMGAPANAKAMHRAWEQATLTHRLLRKQY